MERAAAFERRRDHSSNDSQLCRGYGRRRNAEMNATAPLTALSLLERLAFEMQAPVRTPVSLEYDPAYEAGRTLFDHLAVDVQAREVLRKALSESGGAGTDTTIIDPIFSPRATVQDVEWFRGNPSRSHSIRPAIEGEPVLAGRTPASEYIAVVRQAQGGVRLVVAIPLALMIIDPTRGTDRWEDDEFLSTLFEIVARATPGHYIHIDKIIAYVDALSSAAAPVDGLKRRPS
jgi:hypothetical protein